MQTVDRRTVLAGAASLAVALPAGARAAAGAFPAQFLWGAATAGHQVEGNNSNSDVWFVENLPRTAFAERSGDAANSFDLWRTDLDLVKGLGLPIGSRPRRGPPFRGLRCCGAVSGCDGRGLRRRRWA